MFYNDIVEEGTNELEGIVFADVLLRSDPSETVVLQYCAFRSNDADFSDSLALIPEESGGNDCSRFDIQAEFDTPYAVSIELDREAGTLIFSANDAVNTFAIPTPIFFVPMGQFLRAQAVALVAQLPLSTSILLRSRRPPECQGSDGLMMFAKLNRRAYDDPPSIQPMLVRDAFNARQVHS